MMLPDEYDATLARLLTRSENRDYVASVTDPGTRRDLKELPAVMDAAGLLAALQSADAEYDWSALDPMAIAARLIAGCAEFGAIRKSDEDDGPRDFGALIRWVWRRTTARRADRAVLGTTAVIGQAERDLWPEGAGPAPWWQITLSLQAWIALTSEQRVRLVHHELCHVGVTSGTDNEPVPCINGHDIEENLSTIARFGLMDQAQGKVIAAAMSHPSTPERQRSWYVDEATGQGMLWPMPIGQDMISSRRGEP